MSKQKIWVVVTSDDTVFKTTSVNAFHTKEEAYSNVEQWFSTNTEDFDEFGYEWRGDYNNGYAYIEHNGYVEWCEAISVEL